jgi:hypothetical protein
MRTCALEYDFVFLEFINEQPVRFYMTLPPAFIVANKRVIAIARAKGYFVN